MENNNQDIKLCPFCGEKNKSTYKYCNGCGAPLNQTENIKSMNTPVNNPPMQTSNMGYYGRQTSQYGYTPNYIPYSVNTKPIYEGVPDFNGVSAKDIYEFTGKEPELFSKLRTQHFSGEKGPYCWPLFVLGLVLGFFGMGCWYLYHKMYKPAIGFFVGAVVNVAMSVFSALITLEQTFNNITPDMYDSFIKNFLEGNFTGLTDGILSVDNSLVSLLESVLSSVQLGAIALAIILPFFAYRQYKNFAIEKIYIEYSKNSVPDLAKKGGTKRGLVVLASILYGVTIPLIAISASVGIAMDFYKKDSQFSNDDTNNGQYEELPFDFDDDTPGDFW